MKNKNYRKEKKKKKERHSVPLKRKIHINGKEWRWEYDPYLIKILSPENKYYAFYDKEVTGVENKEDLDKPYVITPGIVKDFIINKILKDGNK